MVHAGSVRLCTGSTSQGPLASHCCETLVTTLDKAPWREESRPIPVTRQRRRAKGKQFPRARGRADAKRGPALGGSAPSLIAQGPSSGRPASFGMAGAAESPAHHRHYEPLRRLLRLQPARDILKAPKNVHFPLALNNPIAHHRMLVDLRLLRLAETHAKRLHARPELLLARRIVLGDDDDRQSPVSPFQRRSLDL